MSAPYTHTVELPYDAQKCHTQIASLVDKRFALIVTGARFAQVSDAAWRATKTTGDVYRVELYDEDAVIVSKIA